MVGIRNRPVLFLFDGVFNVLRARNALLSTLMFHNMNRLIRRDDSGMPQPSVNLRDLGSK